MQNKKKIVKKHVKIRNKIILFLFVIKILPPKKPNIELTVQNQELFIHGEKNIIEEYYQGLQKNINDTYIQLVRFKTDTQIDLIQFQMTGYKNCMIVKPKTLEYVADQIVKRYKFNEIKNVIDEIKSKGHFYIIVSCDKNYQEEVMGKIDQLAKQFIRNQTSNPNQESPQIKKKKKYVQKKNPLEQSIISKGDAQQNRQKSYKTKKLLYSIQLSSNIFDQEHFRNWLRQNKDLTSSNFQYQRDQDQQTIVVSLICDQVYQNKIKAIKLYMEQQIIIDLEKMNDFIVVEIINKFHNPPYVTIKRIEGFVPPKASTNDIKNLIKENNLSQSVRNIQKINILLLTGLITEVFRVQKQIHRIFKEEKNRQIIEHIAIQLKHLKDHLNDKKVKELVNRIIQSEINMNFKLINRYEINFTGNDLMIKIQTTIEKKQKLQIFKKEITKILSDKIKTHTFQKFQPKLFNKFKNEYIIFEIAGGYRLIQTEDKITTVTALIIKQVSNYNNKIMELKFTVQKNKIKNLQLYFASLKQKNEKYKNIKNIQADTSENISTLVLVGPADTMESIGNEINQYLEQLNIKTFQDSHFISDQQAFLINQNHHLNEQLEKYKVSFNLRQNIEIQVLAKIGQNIKIQVFKKAHQRFERLPQGTVFFFKNKDEIEKCKNAFVKNFKQQIKNIKNLSQPYIFPIRNYNLIYFQDYRLSQAIDLAQNYPFNNQCRIGFFMPQKQKKQFLTSIINILLRMINKNISIVILETNQIQDLQKAVDIKIVPQKHKKQKIIKWYTQDEGKKLYYSEEGMKKINEAINLKKQIIYFSNQDLQLTIDTHVVNPANRSMVHIRSGKNFPLKQDGNDFIFTVNNQEFRFNNPRSKESQFKVSIGIYLIHIQKREQYNLFSGFKRKILSEEEDNIQLFDGKVSIDYCLKVNELTLQGQNLQGSNLKQAWLHIQQYFQSSIISRQICVNIKVLSDNSAFQEILNIAKQTHVKIQSLNQRKDILKIKAYNKTDLSRFQKLLSFFQKTYHQSQIKYPKYWEQAKQTSDIQLIEVNQASDQFKDVQKQFTTSKIIKLERIQNSIVYKKYYEEKLFLTEMNEGKLVKQMMLYHGTRATPPSEIYGDKEQAFNINYTSQSNYLGKGIYFAQRSEYSNNYSYTAIDTVSKRHFLDIFHKKQCQQMFYCQVLVGESQPIKVDPGNTQKFSGLKDTSYKNPAKKLRFQSTTSFLAGSNVFVVYKSRRAYPLYLISY